MNYKNITNKFQYNISLKNKHQKMQLKLLIDEDITYYFDHNMSNQKIIYN